MFKSIVIQQTVSFILFYILFSSLNDNTFYEDKKKEFIVFLIMYLLYMLSQAFLWLLKPIKINITQTNAVGEDIKQTIILKKDGENKTSQELRTIALKVELVKVKSIWWPLLKVCNNLRNISIMVEPVPQDLYLKYSNETISELKDIEYGFIIDLNSIFNQLYSQEGTMSVKKEYLYYVSDHPDIIIAEDITSVVKPYIVSSSKNKDFDSDRFKKILFLKLILKLSTTQHEVKYFVK